MRAASIYPHDRIYAIAHNELIQYDISYRENVACKKLIENAIADGTVVQRDLYSAFLLAHLNKNLVTYNNQSIKKDFPQFLTLHEQTKKRLQSSHDWLPASVGF